MISTEAVSPAATTKALSSFSSSLPPPYAFEDLYSSYQNEWDQQPETSNPEDTNNDIDNDDDFDITKGVSNLQWITIPNESNNKNDTFLLACTDAGEIVTWKLVGKEQDKAVNNDIHSRLEPHSRVTISNNNGAVAEETTTNDEKKGSIDDERLTFSSLNELCIVTVDDGNARNGEATSARGAKHTKKRPRKETNDSSDALVQNRVVLVAGSDGLWCIPLLDVLQEKPSTNSNDSQQQQQSNYKPPPSSLVQLSDRPIRTVTSYTTSSHENKDDSSSSSCCFVLALEEHSNNLCQWNLSTILKNNQCSVVEVVANDTTIIAATPTTKDWKTDLSQIFSNNSGTKKNKSKTKIANRRDDNNNERATTMLVVKTNAKHDETNSNSNGFQLLVGTDRSRLWILDEESIRKKTHRGVWSLYDKSSSTQNNNTAASLKNNSSVVWTVTDIVETKGAWWTVSATTKTTSATRNKNSSSSNATPPSGLLVTWHAPTGMVMAREETREAIQAISQTHDKQKLYSAANESAIAVWESSFSLRRQGRFWASPPAIRTLAICCDNDSNSLPKKNLLAVAGVGNKVDIFLDQCRVETLRI